jgi:hypothetical protein
MNRRNFVFSYGGALALATVSGGVMMYPVVSAANDEQPRVVLAQNLSCAAFSAYTNEQFDLSDSQDNWLGKITLVSTKDGRSEPGHTEFVVGFETDVVLENGTYTLFHPQAGALELFLQAAGDPVSNKAYRAEFSLTS